MHSFKSCTKNQISWPLIALCSIFLRYFFAFAATPDISFYSSKSLDGGSTLSIDLSVSVSVAGTIYCLATSPSDPSYYNATVVTNAGAGVTYSSAGDWGLNLTGIDFPEEGYMFSNGPWFSLWTVHCAAEDTSGDLSNVITNNFTTSGTLDRIITVNVIKENSQEGIGYAEINIGPSEIPIGPTRVEVQSSDMNEAIVSTVAEYTTRKASFVFTPGFWNSTVYFIGQEDGIQDGTVEYAAIIRLLGSMDERYKYVPLGLTLSVPLYSIDSSSAEVQYGDAFTIERRLSVNRLNNVTIESATDAVAIAQVKLTAQPLGKLTFKCYSTDAGEAFVMYPSLFHFSPDDWDTYKTIYSKTMTDEVFDAIASYKILVELIQSEDPIYDRRWSLTRAEFSIQNQESQSVGIRLTENNCGSTWPESAGPCFIKISLCFWPFSGQCEIPSTTELLDLGFNYVSFVLEISDSSVATFADGSTLKTLNWDIESDLDHGKTVFLIPVNDDLADGDQSMTLDYSSAIVTDSSGTEADMLTTKIDGFPIEVTSVDDEQAGINFDDGDCLYPQTSEDGQACVIYISLKSEPYFDVGFKVSVSNTDYAVIDEVSSGDEIDLIFTPDDWNEAQTVTIVGQDVDTVSNDVLNTYFVYRSATTSSDTAYDFPTARYNFTNADNDFDGLYMGELTDVSTNEIGLSQNVTTGLLSMPADHVEVYLHSTDTSEAIVWPAKIYYLSGSLDALQAEGFASVCDSSETLSCSGTCLSATNCVSSSVGYTSCLEWVQDGTCHDSSSLSDDGSVMDFSCALFGNDGGDCSSCHESNHRCSEGPTINGTLYTNWSTEVTLDIVGQDDNIFDGPKTYEIKAYSISDDARFSLKSFSRALINYDDEVLQINDRGCILDESYPWLKCEIELTVYSNVNKYRYLEVTASSSWPSEATVSPSNMTITTAGTYFFYVEVHDDLFDDGNTNLNITMGSRLHYNHHGVTGSKSAGSQVVQTFIYDNDTAGVALFQGSQEWISYKRPEKRDPNDLDLNYEYLGTVEMPNRTTSEADKSQNVTFSISLVSPPTSDVTVSIVSEMTDTNGGSLRFEGVPLVNDQTTQKNPYSWSSEDVKIFDELIATIDTVIDEHSELIFTFSANNWNQRYDITVVGLDDAVDDYTMEYNLWITASSDDNYYNDHFIVLPLLNEDNDKAGLRTKVVQKECSEPDYDLTAELALWVVTEPKEAILLTITSDNSAEAKPDEAITAINKNNWQYPIFITVSSIDDRYKDGDIHFNVSIAIVFSEDPEYGSSEVNPDGEIGIGSETASLGFISVDDPSDSNPTACDKGQYGNFPDCYNCPVGTFVEIAGDKAACRFCPPGTYGLVMGAEAMGVGIAWDGNLVDPGCLPCPQGFYSDQWGLQACQECPEGFSCLGLATTTPTQESNRTNFVEHVWTLVEVAEFEVAVAGHDISMELFQGTLLIIGVGVVSILAMAFVLVLKFGKESFRGKVTQLFAKVDKFVDEHLDIYSGEEGGAAIGGFMTIGAGLLSVMMVGLMIYLYLFYNVWVNQNIVPLDLQASSEILSEFHLTVNFEGFSGCIGSNGDLNGDGKDDVTPQITVGAIDYYTSSSQCAEDGSYEVTVDIPPLNVDDVPEIGIMLSTECDYCDKLMTDSGDALCGDCALISAQAISFKVTATNTYPADVNEVYGTLLASGEGASFRGSSPTEISINLIPTFYDNKMNGYTSSGYRLQYSDSAEGDTAVFTTQNGTAPSFGLLDEYIIDDGFVSTDVVNEVFFKATLTVTTFQLNIETGTELGWLDLLGELGGIVTSILGLTIMAMLKVEQIMDPKSREQARERVMSGIMSVRNFAASRSPRARARTPELVHGSEEQGTGTKWVWGRPKVPGSGGSKGQRSHTRSKSESPVRSRFRFGSGLTEEHGGKR